jgi:hypothetical protein
LIDFSTRAHLQNKIKQEGETSNKRKTLPERDPNVQAKRLRTGSNFL